MNRFISRLRDETVALCCSIAVKFVRRIIIVMIRAASRLQHGSGHLNCTTCFFIMYLLEPVRIRVAFTTDTMVDGPHCVTPHDVFLACGAVVCGAGVLADT